MRTSRLLAAVGAVAFAGSAAAQYTVTDPGPVNVASGVGYELDISTGSTLGTSYNSVDISLDWTPGATAWSGEAGVGIFSGSGQTGTVFFPFQGSPDGLGGYDPVTLTWSGGLNETYTGGDPLFLFGDQVYPGSNANWANISVTLNEGVVDPIVLADTDSVAHAPNQYHMWDLVIDNNGTEVILDTLGTTTTDTGFGPNDTEMWLLDTDGTTVIATNDDIDFGGGNLLSQVGATLDAGTYSVVVGTFNIDYDGTSFTTDTTGSGNIVVNASGRNGGAGIDLVFNSTVPEPGSLALLGLGGLALLRRRR